MDSEDRTGASVPEQSSRLDQVGAMIARLILGQGVDAVIPKEITKQHVLDAISEIDRNGIPENRQARGFELVVEGKAYPPKLVISLASKYATGKELHRSEFSGGETTNEVLKGLGFDIKPKPQQPIRDDLEKIMVQYLSARKERFGKENAMLGLFHDLRTHIERLDSIRENMHAKVRDGVGRGNWANVPWVALMDSDAARSDYRS